MNDIFDNDINNVTKIDNIIGNNIVKDMIQNMDDKYFEKIGLNQK